MKTLVNVLIVLAAIAFAVGTGIRFLQGSHFLGQEPVVYWRGALGFLAFASTFILMQIRDQGRC